MEIAVITTGTFRYGLVVESFHNTEEIVVKPLGRDLKESREYAGATILGDGAVALILDGGDWPQRPKSRRYLPVHEPEIMRSRRKKKQYLIKCIHSCSSGIEKKNAAPSLWKSFAESSESRDRKWKPRADAERSSIATALYLWLHFPTQPLWDRSITAARWP